MSYVPIVVTPPKEPSRQTRELADLLGRVVQEYEKGHPTVTGEEVREALQLARRASTRSGGTDLQAVKLALVGGLTLMAGLVFFFFVRAGGDVSLVGSPVMIAVVAVALVVGFAVFLKRNE